MNTIPTVEDLDLESLPRGELTKLWLAIAEDPLGRPIRLPVMVGRGRRDGPVVGISAALHGNELNGIPVIHRLFQRLEDAPVRGTVVAVLVVNTPGLVRRQRKFHDGTDLNHIFPGRADGTGAQAYVHRLRKVFLEQLDVLFDLHTASFGRTNSLYLRADLLDQRVAQLATCLRPQIIVHNPASDGTLRGDAAGLGLPAITVEIGNPHRFQEAFIKRTSAGLRAALASMGMVARRPLAPGERPVICDRSRWLYTHQGGILQVLHDNTGFVEKGAPVARLTTPFGDLRHEYLAPEDGVIIGRSVDPVAETGARIVHLGHVAPPDHPVHEHIDHEAAAAGQ